MRISGGLLLFKNYDGTPLVSRRKLLRFGNSLDRRVFLGVIDDFDVVLFSSNPKEKSSAVIEWCFCRPRRPKYWVTDHQCLDECLQTSLSRLLFFSLLVRNNWVFALLFCEVSVNFRNYDTKAIRLVIFPVFFTNFCVKRLENFIKVLQFVLFDTFRIAVFWNPRLLASCFYFVEFS